MSTHCALLGEYRGNVALALRLFEGKWEHRSILDGILETSWGSVMTVLNIRGKLGLSEVVDTGDSPQEFVGENPRIDNKFEYDIAVIGLGPVGVRTLHNQCISKERVLGFDASESRLAELSRGSMGLSLLENKRTPTRWTSSC